MHVLNRINHGFTPLWQHFSHILISQPLSNCFENIRTLKTRVIPYSPSYTWNLQYVNFTFGQAWSGLAYFSHLPSNINSFNNEETYIRKQIWDKVATIQSKSIHSCFHFIIHSFNSRTEILMTHIQVWSFNEQFLSQINTSTHIHHLNRSKTHSKDPSPN